MPTKYRKMNDRTQSSSTKKDGTAVRVKMKEQLQKELRL